MTTKASNGQKYILMIKSTKEKPKAKMKLLDN